MAGLSSAQLTQLLTPLHADRVSKQRGQSHLEAWDVRRWLIRIFGFTGWDFEVLESELVYERVDVNQDGKDVKLRATAVYRVTGRLIIKDENGQPIGRWDDGATGDGVNMPSVGDAHDFALKTAMSQALKRCAVNLGDQFGLSLYNGGKTMPVVERTLSSAPDEPLPVDAPVVSDAPADEPPDRPMVRQQPQADDEWTTNEPPVANDKQIDTILRALTSVRGITDSDAKRAAIEAMVEHPVPNVRRLLFGEAVRIIAALHAEHEAKQNQATGTPNNPAITAPQMRMIQAHYSNVDREERLADIHRRIGRKVESANDLSLKDAKRLIDSFDTGEIAVRSEPIGASA